jgi:hypothetical protein
LVDRFSRAHRLPGKTSPELEAQVLALRSDRKLGPARIGELRAQRLSASRWLTHFP